MEAAARPHRPSLAAAVEAEEPEWLRSAAAAVAKPRRASLVLAAAAVDASGDDAMLPAHLLLEEFVRGKEVTARAAAAALAHYGISKRNTLVVAEFAKMAAEVQRWAGRNIDPFGGMPSSTRNDKANEWVDRLRRAVAPPGTAGSGGSDSAAPAEVAPGLFVGSHRHAQDVKKLAALGVRSVLNCAPTEHPRPSSYTAAGIHYKEIFARDDDAYPLIQSHLAEVRTFAGGALDRGDGGVLLHCSQGLNRSAGLALALLLEREGVPLLPLARRCAARRPGMLQRNRGFCKQIVALAASIGLLADGDDLEAATAKRRESQIAAGEAEAAARGVFAAAEARTAGEERARAEAKRAFDDFDPFGEEKGKAERAKAEARAAEARAAEAKRAFDADRRRWRRRSRRRAGRRRRRRAAAAAVDRKAAAAKEELARAVAEEEARARGGRACRALQAAQAGARGGGGGRRRRRRRRRGGRRSIASTSSMGCRPRGRPPPI